MASLVCSTSWRLRHKLAVLFCATGIGFGVGSIVGVVKPADAANMACSPPFNAGLEPAKVVKRTLTSVVLGELIFTDECEVQWMIEWSEGPSGPWKKLGEGVLPGKDVSESFETSELTGLKPETVYYDRVRLDSSNWLYGQFEAKQLKPRVYAAEAVESSIGSTSIRVLGSIEPSPFETGWRIEYSTDRARLEKGEGVLASQGVISQKEAEELQTATGSELVHAEADLTGLSPKTVYYARTVAYDEPEWEPGSGQHVKKEVSGISPPMKTFGPPEAEAFSTPALRLEMMHVLGDVVPDGFDTHYFFEYGPTVAYGSKTLEEDAGRGGENGEEPRLVGADLVGLEAGHSYHYRIVASSTAGVVHGPDHVLRVPEPAPASTSSGCGNERFRVGASVRLGDCRAYEQVTPSDKEGAQELRVTSVTSSVALGEDGDHAVLYAPFTHWGQGQSPYFFNRRDGVGWTMVAGQSQPEAGIDSYLPELFNGNVTEMAFEAEWSTNVGVESPNIEFRTGLAGGPYTTANSVPRSTVENRNTSGWVAASGDFSKLILKAGSDMYEYAGGHLRKINVQTDGSSIGTCSAVMADGHPEQHRVADTGTSGRHSVSQDGSRVFFEVVPGSDCSQPSHLFMRHNDETVDIGVYRFLAADASGAHAVLEARPHEGEEQVVLYDIGTGKAKTLFTLHEKISSGEQVPAIISEDLSTIYLQTTERLTSEAPPPFEPFTGQYRDLYTFVVASGSLRFVAEAAIHGSDITPDGRYFYWHGLVPGLPSRDPLGENAMLYDSVRNVIECVSCASPYNPEPKAGVAALDGTNGFYETRNSTPRVYEITADGSRIFFETPAALLPSDIDGEPEGNVPSDKEGGQLHDDVYEWRRNGIEGCVQVQGCLALITSGTFGSGSVFFIGADASGSDVLFTTREQLVPNDTDGVIDVYDARADGGFPPAPPEPLPCEGDACVNPVQAPIDATPGSLVFNTNDTTGASHPIAHRRAHCTKGRMAIKGRCVRRRARHRKASRLHVHRTGRHVRIRH